MIHRKTNQPTINTFIFSHTFKCFQVLLYNNDTRHYSFLYTNSLFYLTLSGATTPGQSEPGGNGHEEALYIPQIS